MIYMHSKTDDIEKKLRSYLFGTACGDALGRPVEHLTLEQIKEKYGEKGILEVPPDSPWTDDTQLMLVIARGLLRGAELEPPEAYGLILLRNLFTGLTSLTSEQDQLPEVQP